MGDMRICDIEQQGDDVTLCLLVPELRVEMRESFSEDMREALEMGTGLVTFDLTRIDRVYSLFLGLLMDGVWRAKKLERPVRMILKPEMYDHFMDLGVHNAAELVRRE